MRLTITCTLCIAMALCLLPQFSSAQLKPVQLIQEKSDEPNRKFIIGIQDFGFGSPSRFNVSPYIAYNLNKHIAVGAEFRYSNLKSTFDDSGTTVTTFQQRSFGYGLFGRYTVNPKKKLSVFAELTLGHDFINTEDNVARNGATFESDNGFSSRLDFGLKYKINDRFNFILDIRGVSYDFSSNTVDYNFRLDSFSPGIEIKF